MPKRKGPNSEAMIRAAAEGGRLAQQAQEEVYQTKKESAEGFSDVGRQLVGIGERQKDRDTQKEEAEKDRKFRSDEALKDRVARSGDQARELRSREGIEENRLQLEAADKGLVDTQGKQGAASSSGGGASSAARPPLDERQQGLANTMAQAQAENAAKAENGKIQGDKRLEAATDGKNRFLPGEDRKAKDDAERRIKQLNAETAAINARNAAERRKDTYLQAQHKQDQQALKEVRAQMQAPMKADQKLRDDIGTGKMGPDDGRWKQLEEMIDDPLTGQHPSQELVDEVRSHTNGPNIARFISNRQASAGIKMALDTGDLPDSDLIDTTNPMWQQFFAQTKQAEAFLGGSAIGQFVDIKSMQHKQRLVNQAAALMMTLQPMLGAQSPPAQGAQAPQQGGPGVQPQQQQPGGAPAPAAQQQPTAAKPQQSVGQRVEQYGFSGGGPR